MNFKDYQTEASKTIPAGFTKEQMIENAIYGLVGEFGEVVDLLKKAKFQGHELDKEKAILELGDVLWYLAELANGYNEDIYSIYNLCDYDGNLSELMGISFFSMSIDKVVRGRLQDKNKLSFEIFQDLLEPIISLAKKFDTTIEEVARKNIEKLRNRYGDKFDSNKSINRSE